MTSPSGLKDFLGHWQLSRVIDDRHVGRSGRLEGTAKLIEDADGRVSYQETGRLQFDGQPELIATRRYLWTEPEAGQIAVLFEDGRAFHEFALDRQMPISEHVCDPDFYHVTYTFSRWPHWTSEWRVRGPNKDYRMVSAYRPAP